MAILLVVFQILTFSGLLFSGETSEVDFFPIETERDKEIPPAVEKFAEGPAGVLYAVSRKLGFFVSFDDGRSWSLRNSGLPEKTVYPFDRREPRFLTSIGVDPSTEGHVAVTTPDRVYQTFNYGLSWEEIDTDRNREGGWPGTNSYFTAVALLGNRILIGTSYDGFYETTDNGKSWQDLSTNTTTLYRGAGTYEEIAGIAYDPADPGSLIVGVGFGDGLFRWDVAEEKHTNIPFPGFDSGELIRGIQFLNRGVGGQRRLAVYTDNRIWVQQVSAQSWLSLRYPASLRKPDFQVSPEKIARFKRASDRRGIYLTAFMATQRFFHRYLRFCRKHELNSIVIDFKDDFGILPYASKLETPRDVGVIRERFDAKTIIDQAHNEGIYVIARILVFKDKSLYRFRNHDYAVWDRAANRPWAHLSTTTDEETNETVYFQREHWVDPYSPFVWKYNIEIAEELQELGVDEIQFDYIRFPTDGDLSRAHYRHRREGMTKRDALESFLRMAREKIHIPISTDFYGFSAWYRMGIWNGQAIDVLSEYVDVIAPMFYPSHFPRDFYRSLDYLDRAEVIYREGGIRAKSITGNRSIIRPYVQAFLLGSEKRMTEDEQVLYLKRQLEGTFAGPSSGYTLWNASNDYYMVRFPLQALP
jgi:hypothetical protein